MLFQILLWSSTYNSLKPRYVAWDKLNEPQNNGGLGIRNVAMWNKSAMGKQVWNIAQKADNLWVKWVSVVYIKGNDRIEYRAPTGSSWTWKNICRTRNDLRLPLQN